MTYTETIAGLRATGDMNAVLAFLEAIFSAPENQSISGKPSDYLNPENAAKHAPPAALFQSFVEGFQPADIARKVAFLFDDAEFASVIRPGVLDPNSGEWHEIEGPRALLSEADEEMQKFRPFNCLHVLIGDYEHGDAAIVSGHYNPETGEFTQGYQLNAQILGDDESHEDYDIIHALKDHDLYRFTYQGEVLNNHQLYLDLKATLFTPHLTELAQALLADERLARFPKAFPFHILFSNQAYASSEFRYQAPPLTLEKLEALGVACVDLHRESQVAAQETSPAEHYAYLKSWIEDRSHASYNELLELCRSHREAFDALLAEAHELRQMNISHHVAHFSRALWELVDVDPDEVVAFQKALIAGEPPAFDPDSRVSEAQWWLNHGDNAALILRVCEVRTPEPYRDAMAESFTRAWHRLIHHNHPIVRLIARDLRVMPRGTPLGDVEEEGGRPIAPDADDAYIADAIAMLDLMPESFDGYWGLWGFTMGHLKALGPRALDAAPGVEALLTRYMEARFDSQLANAFGEVLFALGSDHVPDEIHRAQSRYGSEDYYKTWVRRGPSRAWETFQAAWHQNAERFASPEPWEEALYDSDAGHQFFAEHLLELGATDTLICAATGKAGPRLTRLIHAFADRKDLDDHLLVALLGSLNELDEARAEKLEYARVAELIRALERDDNQAPQTLTRLRERYPQNPALAFIAIDQRVRQGDIASAMHLLVDTMRERTADDLVYRRAFHDFCLDPTLSFAMSPENTYPFFWMARRAFQNANFRDGQFSGDVRTLKKDRFFDVFYTGTADHSDDQVQRWIDEARGEWTFLQDVAARSNEDLSEELESFDWPVARAIAARLVDTGDTSFAPALADFFERVADHEERRATLAGLIWPLASRELLQREAFLAYIPTFVCDHPAPLIEITREVLVGLEALDRRDLIVTIAPKLPAQAAVSCFKNILNAHIATRAFDEAEALFARLAGGMTEIVPDWLLIQNNRAVLLIVSGQMERAEALFDEVFSKDFRRFEPRAPDPAAIAIFGNDLDQQVIDVFQTYFAMARFNQACLFALTDRPDEAVASLEVATARGHYSAEKLLAESDFASLHDHPGFQQLIATLNGEQR
ncbi:hypothetical protein FRC96_06860 [Lujinxingia vulgaris]|uniref:Uncharacterized protein n=1 Tax=Lujinxingia vulgaris TaxID=2600176 RepID=A0A5C6XDZ3_9DELT|nr:hypothetical protein [Lujinxingia vulgaris]TXD39641.1 hypothetical protein FRC96_06860 [Lujinxingia vulgaris]